MSSAPAPSQLVTFKCARFGCWLWGVFFFIVTVSTIFDLQKKVTEIVGRDNTGKIQITDNTVCITLLLMIK